MKEEVTKYRDLEVSFNSPQCGWMSIGFEDGNGEFHTTTSHAPHSRALADILETLSKMLEMRNGVFARTLRWNRDPEEYDLVFKKDGNDAGIEIYEYPTKERNQNERELVFSHRGNARQIAEAFFNTFRQLYDERQVDDFNDNWHQEFPLDEFEDLKRALS